MRSSHRVDIQLELTEYALKFVADNRKQGAVDRLVTIRLTE